MSPQKQFRLLQRKLDDLGYMTSINRIIAGKRYEVTGTEDSVQREIIDKIKNLFN